MSVKHISFLLHKNSTNIMALLQILFLAIMILETSHGLDMNILHQIHLRRPELDKIDGHVPGGSCLSWRLGVETNNIIGWKTVPLECEVYVGNYMLGQQYRKDSKAVVGEAFLYVKGLNLSHDGKDIWVFDIDETALSNLPYESQHGFGAQPFDYTSYTEWVFTGKAPALPETLSLYKSLVSLGFKIVFITGRSEDQRSVTINNLKEAGYHTWMKLIFRSSTYSGKTSVFYKSSERGKLVKSGYRIIGNIGDQWSDLLGTHTANRSFKLPNPMQYTK